METCQDTSRSDMHKNTVTLTLEWNADSPEVIRSFAANFKKQEDRHNFASTLQVHHTLFAFLKVSVLK